MTIHHVTNLASYTARRAGQRTHHTTNKITEGSRKLTNQRQSQSVGAQLRYGLCPAGSALRTYRCYVPAGRDLGSSWRSVGQSCLFEGVRYAGSVSEEPDRLLPKSSPSLLFREGERGNGAEGGGESLKHKWAPRPVRSLTRCSVS